MSATPARNTTRTGLRAIRARLQSPDGAIDLASIMVGVLVVGVVGSVISATVFAVIPWSQDEAAKQSITAAHSAESVHRTLNGKFASTPDLGELLPISASLAVGAGANGDCYVAVAKSDTGALFYGTEKSPDVNSLTPKTALPCLDGDGIDSLVGAVGGWDSSTVSAPVIDDVTVPPAALNTAYSLQLRSSAADAVYSVASGSLPTGLSLSPEGLIHGVASVAGTYTFSIAAENSGGRTVHEMTIVTNIAAPVIVSTFLSFEVGVSKPTTISVVSAGPVTYEITSGQLPAGLTLGSDGRITGRALAAGAGVRTVTLAVTNSGGTTSKAITIEVEPIFVEVISGAFESSLAGWEVSSSENGELPRLTTTAPYAGASSLLVTAHGTATSPRIAVVGGEILRVSGAVRFQPGTNEPGSTAMGIQWFGASGEYITGSTIGSQATATAWKTLQNNSVMVPAGAKFASVVLDVGGNSYETNKATASWDSISVQARR